MRVAEMAVSHFRAKLAQPKVVVTVDAWKDEEGNPAKLAFRHTTLEMDAKILKATEDGGSAAGIVETLILRAVDPETGAKAFQVTEKNELLKRTDPDVLYQLMTDLRKAEGELSLEQAEQD